MRRCIVVIAAVGALLLGATAASGKLPPVDLSATQAVPFGASVAVRMWFVDDEGLPLEAADVRRWAMPARVRGWVWAYPDEAGRPDPDHSGIRVPLTWKDDHYEGGFRPDEPGPWLVVPFGADHSMPDLVGPAEPVHVSVGRIEGTVSARAEGATGRVSLVAETVEVLVSVAAVSVGVRRRRAIVAR